MPKLHIMSGQLEGKVFDLLEERVTIGRGLDNLIRMEDGTMSHHHAMFVLENDGYKLRDLNSTNGTRVNGMRIAETKLNNGDAVRMGSVEMRFESDIKKASRRRRRKQEWTSARSAKAADHPPRLVPPLRSAARKKAALMSGCGWCSASARSP